MIRPNPLALGISRIYGTCILQRALPLLWPTCPDCRGRSMLTVCRMCGNTGKVPVLA